MNTTVRFARATLGAMVLTMGSLWADTHSLLPNASLEKDAKADGWPDGWGRPKEGGSWVEENGNHFLRLAATTPGAMIMLYQPVPLPLGTEALELTWRQRVTDLRTGKQPWFDARILLETKDASGQKLKPAPSAPNTRKNTKGWEERRTAFLLPAGAVTLEFMPSLFQVESGTFDLDDLVLKPVDPAPLRAEAVKREARERAARVEPENPVTARWPKPLHTEGNRLLDSAGQPVLLQGVNVVSLEFSQKGEQVLKSTLVAIDDWKSNALRLPVKEHTWFGEAEGQTDGGKDYRAVVDDVITLAANRGAYVLLDLHRFGAPTEAHARFWKDAATRYKDHPAVVFDLFNEAHGTGWEAWRNGGPVKIDGKEFVSVGMQGLVEAARSTGAKNLMVAGGLDWSYDLSGITPELELKDPGGNGIVYSSHIYPWKRDWERKVLVLAERYPLLVGEVGADLGTGQEDPHTWIPDMLGFIQKHRLHWTAFAFHPKATPILITDWDYTPSPHWGVYAKRALAGESFPMKKPR